MLIEYYGHSCFRIKDFHDTGYKIVVDPYTNGVVPGLKPLPDDLTANVILCSHQHEDHNGVSGVKLVEFEEGESPFIIDKIESFHDDEKGAKRGNNTIYIMTLKKTGQKVIHYGDLGEKIDDLLTPENLAKLEGADYALVPVGGVYTIDADQALELIDRTKPKMAIAMHYRSNSYKCGYSNISTDEDFLIRGMETCHNVQFGRFSFIDTEEDVLPYELMSLKPECSIVNK